MRACAQCGGSVERTFRFCPWCASAQRLKIVDFFRADPRIEQDRDKALRVSRYLDPLRRHVRFSVWDESVEPARARAAISLDEDEAERLARFLADTAVPAYDESADTTLH
jgi:hypothetical protein